MCYVVIHLAFHLALHFVRPMKLYVKDFHQVSLLWQKYGIHNINLETWGININRESLESTWEHNSGVLNFPQSIMYSPLIFEL